MRTSILKEQQYKMNIVGNSFTSCPSQDYTRVYITGEIVSADDFTAQQMLVFDDLLPQSMNFEFPQQIQQLALTQDELLQFNCSQSITQCSQSVISYTQDGKETYTYNISFPIDLQILVAQTNKNHKQPTLYFQVFSIDSWDRTVMIGCGFIDIPITPGTFETSVGTWKPLAGLQSKVSQFFLGGSSKVKNIYQISNIQITTQTNSKAPQNKILTHTESGGHVLFRFNVATQSKKVKLDSRKQAKSKVHSELVQIQKQKKPSKSQISPFINTGHGYSGRYSYNNPKLN